MILTSSDPAELTLYGYGLGGGAGGFSLMTRGLESI